MAPNGYGYEPHSMTSLRDDQEGINRFMRGTVLHDGLESGEDGGQMTVNDVVFPQKLAWSKPLDQF